MDSFSFKFNNNYKTNEVYLNVCIELLPITNIVLNSTIQTFQPTITINTLQPQLNSSAEQENKENKTNSDSFSSNENILNKKQKNEKITNDGISWMGQWND